MRLAVTGAAGFVGGAVVAAARARGWTVHPLTRREWDVTTGPLPDPPCVDAVVHRAAVVTDAPAAAPVWAANLHGTRHVAASFPAARLVHVSTASVYDPRRPTVLAREDAAPVARYDTPYAASKAAAERLLAGRPDTVVLRPHAVYGPGDPTLLPRVLGGVRGRTLVVPGHAGVRHTLTGVDVLADAALRACAAPPGVYNVGDAAPVALGDALAALVAARGLDVRVRFLPVPAALALTALPAVRRRGLTRYAVGHLGLERTLDLTAARAGLGLAPPPTSFDGAAGW